MAQVPLFFEALPKCGEDFLIYDSVAYTILPSKLRPTFKVYLLGLGGKKSGER